MSWERIHAEAGDTCSNTPFLETFTCPNCYHDFREEVEVCEVCGAPLECEIVKEPVYKTRILYDYEAEALS